MARDVDVDSLIWSHDAMLRSFNNHLLVGDMNLEEVFFSGRV